MKKSVFIRFLIFSLLFFTVVLVLIILIDIIKDTFVFKDTLIVILGILLLCILFSLFASIYAKRVTIISDKDSINESLKNIENNNKFIVDKDSGIITISSSKYYEWFYGKTIINTDSENYRIEGAKCVIKKYFKLE